MTKQQEQPFLEKTELMRMAERQLMKTLSRKIPDVEKIKKSAFVKEDILQPVLNLVYLAEYAGLFKNHVDISKFVSLLSSRVAENYNNRRFKWEKISIEDSLDILRENFKAEYETARAENQIKKDSAFSVEIKNNLEGTEKWLAELEKYFPAAVSIEVIDALMYSQKPKRVKFAYDYGVTLVKTHESLYAKCKTASRQNNLLPKGAYLLWKIGARFLNKNYDSVRKDIFGKCRGKEEFVDIFTRRAIRKGVQIIGTRLLKEHVRARKKLMGRALGILRGYAERKGAEQGIAVK